ncbi:hypothetical protein HY967_04115 [Candidatus Jorgensenbacteria bacterium]|nr:hypothetical protein [Candidatus Jorgensenbacteria bacterium]
MKRISSFLFKNKYVFFLVLLSLVVAREWFLPGLPQTHDAEVHISRSYEFFDSLSEGNVLPRWAGRFNWTYGTPAIMFLYPVEPYVAALIHSATRLSFIDVFKLLLVLSYVGSGIAWHLWLRELKFSEKASFVGSVFYLLAPYRLVDMFVRGALAEHVCFFFLPLILFFFTKLWRVRRKRWFVASSVSIGILIGWHNLSALMYIPIVLLYPIFLKTFNNEISFKRDDIARHYSAIFFGVALTTFFWLPALLESRYTLASWLFPVQQGYRDHFLAFWQLVWSKWGYGFSLPGTKDDGMSFQIGVAHWLVLIVGLFLAAFWFIKKKLSWRNPKQVFLLGGFSLILIGGFFVLPISLPIWERISLLQKFQLPWRFLSYIVIGTSMVAAILTEHIRGKKVFAAMLVLPIISSVYFWHTGGPSSLTEAFLTVNYVGTSDTGESTPVWAVRFQEKFPKAPVEVVSSSGRVVLGSVKKQNNLHEFTVNANADARLVDNTLYFPGWKVLVDGREVPTEYQDENWRGLITFPIKPGEHTVRVLFEETLLRKIADAVSIISAGALIAIAL